MSTFFDIPLEQDTHPMLISYNFDKMLSRKPKNPVCFYSHEKIMHHYPHKSTDISIEDTLCTHRQPIIMPLKMKVLEETLVHEESPVPHFKTTTQMEIEEKISSIDEKVKSQIKTIAKCSAEIDSLPPPSRSNELPCKNKILALDLDETLIYHLDTAPVEKVSLVHKVENSRKPLYFMTRPYLREFLSEMSQHFTLVVFTSACRSYANAIIQMIDPTHCIKKVYSFKYCQKVSSLIIKDLRIVCNDLDNIILVDDHISSFSKQLANGICIKPFFGDQHDVALPLLTKQLIKVKDSLNLREQLTMEYNYQQLYDYYSRL